LSRVPWPPARFCSRAISHSLRTSRAWLKIITCRLSAPSNPALPTPPSSWRPTPSSCASSPASKIEPEYSEEARVAKIQGTVVLSIVIGVDGHAYDATLARSIGFGLDEKALDAVMQWQFKPGTQNGLPVPVMAQIEVNFRLL